MQIKITDNFKARKLYQGAIFCAKMINDRRANFISYSSDKTNHSWAECIIKLNGNKIRLRLYTPHDGNMMKKFGKETLDLEFFGDDATKKSSKKDLEGITGIKID